MNSRDVTLDHRPYAAGNGTSTPPEIIVKLAVAAGATVVVTPNPHLVKDHAQAFDLAGLFVATADPTGVGVAVSEIDRKEKRNIADNSPDQPHHCYLCNAPYPQDSDYYHGRTCTGCDLGHYAHKGCLDAWRLRVNHQNYPCPQCSDITGASDDIPVVVMVDTTAATTAQMVQRLTTIGVAAHINVYWTYCVPGPISKMQLAAATHTKIGRDLINRATDITQVTDEFDVVRDGRHSPAMILGAIIPLREHRTWSCHDTITHIWNPQRGGGSDSPCLSWQPRGAYQHRDKCALVCTLSGVVRPEAETPLPKAGAWRR